MKKDQILKIVESTVVSIASSFPIASSLATGWNEYKNSIQQKHINDILQAFFERLKLIEENIDVTYLKSDNLKSLIIKTCFYGNEEFAENKRKILGIFLANSCSLQNSKNITKFSILEILIKLSEFDILLMSKISETLHIKQKSMLLGKTKYAPNSIPWGYESEINIIKKLKKYNEIDVLNTLHFLNSIGVIENSSSRTTSNLNTKYIIEDYLINKRFYELQIEREELLKIKTPKTKEIEKQRDIEKKIKTFYKENTNQYEYNIEKYYNISSLGIQILEYIKEE